MGFFSDLFGGGDDDGDRSPWTAIKLSESQKFADKFLWDLLKKIEKFAPRRIAGLTPAERGAVGITERVVSEGVPGVSEAMQVLTQRMAGDPEQVPGLEGLFTKTRELGADLLGRTKRGLAMTGNLPTESSRGERIYGRTLQDILEGLVTAAFPFYSQGLAAKYAAPGQLASLGMQDVSMRTGLGTTVGALPRQIEQSVYDAILEAQRTTQTFPYTKAPVAQSIMNQQRYIYEQPYAQPNMFNQMSPMIGQMGGSLLKGGAGGLGNLFGGIGKLGSGAASLGSGALQAAGSLGSGAIQGIGSILALLSDVRFKEHIKPIANALEKVKLLEGKTYNFKTTPDKRDAGLIAQELEKVLPEAVIEKDGIKYIKYEAVIALLVNAVNELAERAA